MKDCWQILNVEPYTDKKTVKCAYARLLKQNRPDDDPQAFRQLHDAYKQALLYSVEDERVELQWEEPEAVGQQSAVTVDVVKANETEAVLHQSVVAETEAEMLARVEEHLFAAPAVSVEPDMWVERHLSAPVDSVESRQESQAFPQGDPAAWQADWDEDWEKLFKRVMATFKVKDAGSKVSWWTFIERNPSLLDIEFRAAVSDRLFEIVAEANEISLQSKSLFFKPPVLNYFNRLFAWDDKWQEYSQMFPQSQLDAVLPYLESRNANSQPATMKVQPQDLHYYPRIFAFFLDILLFVAFMYGLDKTFALFGMSDDTVMLVNIYAGLAYFLLVIPLCEASPWQASIGKKVMGLRVVNGKGIRMSWYHSLGRGILASLGVVGIKLTVWVNFFMARYKNMLLQDWLSRSYVIKG